MKVTTKVVAGAGLLVAILLVALVQDIRLVRALASGHRTLSEQRFVAVTSTLELLRALEQSRERLQKFIVTRDQAYAEHLDRLGATVDGHLALQKGLGLPAAEARASEALAGRWQAYRALFLARRAELPAARPPERDALRAELLQRVDEVSRDALALLSVLRTGIETDVARSQEEARRGERLSWTLAALAVCSAAFFVALTLRSLNRPLSRLIAATRSVAAGRAEKVSPRGSDELAELGRAFDAMVERLDELDRMKRDFLSRVSHELKTPLSAMQETNQLLVEELAGPLTAKQRRLLQLNLDAGRRLSAMLSRLLDLSRLEAGAVTYDLRPVPLGELLATALQEFEARLRDKRLQPTLTLPEAPLVVHADRDWLLQVLANLLENAVKFSPPERRLWLELRRSAPAALPSDCPPAALALLQRLPCALVTVADEGPGLPENARERIFERFFQVDRRPRAGSGVGLGLAICRDVVSAHGGVLWAENRVGGGSVFAVALPLPEAGAEEKGGEHADVQPRAGAAAGRV